MSLGRAASLTLGLALAALAVGADQFGKQWAMGALLDPPRRLPVTDFFGFAPAWNRGISFGLLNGGEGGTLTKIILIGGALLVAALLIGWLKRAERRLLAAGIGLILGGAIGNAIDRAVYGAVFDFIDVVISGWHFWTFNIADAAISVGVALLLFDGLFGAPRRSK